jgi:hypothetical protein
MSVTAAEAYAAVRDRLEASDPGIDLPLRWHGEDSPVISDTPAAFGFVVFDNEGSGQGPAAFGGGRGNNLYRNQVILTVYVFWPRGEGLQVGLEHAETVAARMRSFRSSTISCFSADVLPAIGDGSRMSPPGMSRGNEVDNYQCVLVEVELHFDQIG